MNHILRLSSISDVSRMLGGRKAMHPLITVISNDCIGIEQIKTGCRIDLYAVIMKEEASGKMKYGRGTYDFDEGVMMFIAPGQVVAPSEELAGSDAKGWTLLFHPDLIRRASLGKKINQYSFFSYDVKEALHLSDLEKQTLTELIQKVRREIEQPVDRHTENLICGSIELMLDYCTRFYDRQFYTRSNQSRDKVGEFEHLLRDYFSSPDLIEHGIPNVSYCGKQLGVSPNYLSDMLKKETGKTAKEHIQEFIVEQAKNRLLGSEKTISQIAFDLGFDYPAHFTKLFKNSTGESPSQFRRRQ